VGSIECSIPNQPLSADGVVQFLRRENIGTWFDLGLFLDRLAEERARKPIIQKPIEASDFSDSNKNVAFLSFFYGIDGVTMEVAKYAQVLDELFPTGAIHFVAGRIEPQASGLLPSNATMHTLPSLDGFDRWPLYSDFFSTRLKRGGSSYNRLIENLWEQTLQIVDELGRLIEAQDIGLLFLINTHSNPGNVAMALAVVLLSEMMGILVLNNCHDFYFEGGMSEKERKASASSKGPRDHFFTNAHLGELFSVVQVLYPWNSPHWLTVTINQTQADYLVQQLGHPPHRVMQICTALDTTRFKKLDSRAQKQALRQLEIVLAGGRNVITTCLPSDLGKTERLRAPYAEACVFSANKEQLKDFRTDNLIFLQPTRLLSRKRFERNFVLVERLFERSAMDKLFSTNPNMTLTLLVTGPVADGHNAYLEKIVKRFEELLSKLDHRYRNRIYLALLFGSFDQPHWRAQFGQKLGIAELYQLASLVLLPSKTEGRGLPIIESCAAGVPILARRYEPEQVYAQVVGEHLSKENRLDIFSFKGPKPPREMMAGLEEQILYPHLQTSRIDHNQRVVQKRYSMAALASNLNDLCRSLSGLVSDTSAEHMIVEKALEDFDYLVNQNSALAAKLLQARNRQYLPGYGKMAFMTYLNSLIDPSSFRREEQEIRGRAMAFAQRLVDSVGDKGASFAQSVGRFYRCVDILFCHRQGDEEIRHDHSMAYRHRNTFNYSYRDKTPQELSGVINLLFQKVCVPTDPEGELRLPPKQFSTWHRMVGQLCGSQDIAIDHRSRLSKRLLSDEARVIFTGRYILHELELFVVHPIRQRLGLEDWESLDATHLNQQALPISYLVKRKASMGNHLNAQKLRELIDKTGSDEIKMLFKHGVCQIVESTQLSVGIDIRQLGESALKVLVAVQEEGGFMVTANRHAAMMTDIVDLERFHIGQANDPLDAGLLGIKFLQGYVQWVPAGLRYCLAYPTPIQDGLSFSQTLQSKLFCELTQKQGEESILALLKKEAEDKGTPIQDVLDGLGHDATGKSSCVRHGTVNGLYDDGLPWAGVFAHLDQSDSSVNFQILSVSKGTRKVTEFVEDLEKESGHEALVAWNGGYILNAELVGKLGLEESYIGSPLGLLVVDGKVRCPPLFNKPAICVDTKGGVDIRRVRCDKGLDVEALGHSVSFCERHYNTEEPTDEPAFYDLLYPQQSIAGCERIIYRLSGCRIMGVEKLGQNGSTPILPVGLHLSLPVHLAPTAWKVGTILDVTLKGYDTLAQAVEAGPLLVDGGEISLDMEVEGWKTQNSIRTQAARLDYIDMRGPKIAVGIGQEGGLRVLVVHGRIRESVGATHVDMARIMQDEGCVKAMGFDPGGSATLVVGRKNMNVSPYNSRYEESPYTLPPEPRGVASAVVAYMKKT
jgi:hypothetical protein